MPKLPNPNFVELHDPVHPAESTGPVHESHLSLHPHEFVGLLGSRLTGLPAHVLVQVVLTLNLPPPALGFR